SKTICNGDVAVFAPTSTGSPTWQWYQGNSGDISQPVPEETSTSSCATHRLCYVFPTTTTSYWVRATNASGYADSNTATVTVMDVTITSGIQGTSITSGQSVTLSVVATG